MALLESASEELKACEQAYQKGPRVGAESLNETYWSQLFRWIMNLVYRLLLTNKHVIRQILLKMLLKIFFQGFYSHLWVCFSSWHLTPKNVLHCLTSPYPLILWKHIHTFLCMYTWPCNQTRFMLACLNGCVPQKTGRGAKVWKNIRSCDGSCQAS